jgi:regulatory protein YycI of two-component signal transduction system YycFG
MIFLKIFIFFILSLNIFAVENYIKKKRKEKKRTNKKRNQKIKKGIKEL